MFDYTGGCRECDRPFWPTHFSVITDLTTAVERPEAHQVSRGPNGVDGGPFQFQEQHFLIAHARDRRSPAFDGRNQRLDHTEANLVIALGCDAFDMLQQEVTEPFYFGQSLPAQRLEPSTRELKTRGRVL